MEARLIIPPGETLLDIMHDQDIDRATLSSRTGYSLDYVSDVLTGEADIDPGFAARLEGIFGIPRSFWLNLQEIYDRERSAK